MSAGDAFDVFLSYHWRDPARVEAVARWLRDQGLRVFLDRWYLLARRPWPQAPEQALGTCRAAAVFVEPGEMGPWQQREKQLALERQERAHREQHAANRALLPRSPRGDAATNTRGQRAGGPATPISRR